MRVQDMLACAENTLAYTTQVSFDPFRASRMAREAVYDNITIPGEAAGHVPQDVIDRYPEVDWLDIRGMRNNLVHEYFGSDIEIVWDTIRRDLPDLIPKLQRILAGVD